jgi:hypothetical protein
LLSPSTGQVHDQLKPLSMQITLNIDQQSISDWNAFIDLLIGNEGCQEALHIAITSESIWNLMLQYRCSDITT